MTMQRKSCISMLALGASLIAFTGASLADVQVRLEPYVTGLTAPTDMVQPPGDQRKFVTEQFGRVRVIDENGELQGEPFLDIRHKLVDLWSDFDERGLLGITFHPDFQENGKFYVAYSAPVNVQDDLAKMFYWDHTNVVAEYTVSEDNPNRADASSERIISSIDWPQFNHNGHWIGFGEDGYLYISTGDGGYANDWGIGHNVTTGNGQDPTSLHGKILRVDVDSRDSGMTYGIPEDNPFVDDRETMPEIWAMGLRNPWRCTFDPQGDAALICGDVGQNSYETIVSINAGDNQGWRILEGEHCFDYTDPDDHPEDCDTEGLVMPILEYENCSARPENCLGISVTGGHVYRGEHAEWDGKYIFGDWSRSFAAMDGQIFFGTRGDDGEWSMEVATTNMEGNNPYMLAFGQDADGEVYALTSITTGPVGGLDTIYRIVPAGDETDMDGQSAVPDDAGEAVDSDAESPKEPVQD